MTNDPVFIELLARAVQRSKAEIENLVYTFVVPSDIESFAELHDFTDANELGGFCDKESRMELNTKLANGQDFVGSVDFEDAELCDAAQHLMICCQHEIDVWIRGGGAGGLGRTETAVETIAHVVRNHKRLQTLAKALLEDLEGLMHDRCDDYSDLTLEARKSLRLGPPPAKWQEPAEGFSQ